MLKKYIAVVENANGLQKEVIIAKNRKQAMEKIGDGDVLMLKVQMELAVDKDKVMNGFKAAGLSDIEMTLLEEVLTKGGVFGKISKDDPDEEEEEEKPAPKTKKVSKKQAVEDARQRALQSK